MSKGKAQITVFKSGDKKTLEVMFNPTELGLSENATWKGEEPPFQFNGTKIQDFSVTLFFDSFEEGTDVRDKTNDFVSIIQPTEPGKERKRPPECLFVWGKFKYRGVPTEVSQKFKMFLPNGIPVRADVTLKLKSVLSAQDAAKLRGLEACRKILTVNEDHRLDLIAARELKDPALWRDIAKENNIKNPLAFPTKDDIGKKLIIPD